MNHLIQPGAVVRISSLGWIKPDEGHDLVVAFLGACRLERKPDVPAMLRRLGWHRTFSFEALLVWDDDQTLCDVFSAETPAEAARALARWARSEEQRSGLPITSAQLYAINVGPIGADGVPSTRRGNVFLSWHASAGESIATFVDKYLASTAATSPSASNAAPAADSTAAPSATPSTPDAPAS